MNARTIKRLCKEHGIGTLVGGVYVLSDDDLARLKEHKGRLPGNPVWRELGEQNRRKPRKKARKKR